MAEFKECLTNFQAMDEEIKKLNSMRLSSVHGHNKFSNMSRAEMKATNGYKPAPKDASVPVHQASNAPASVDWVAAGKVYTIVDQVQSGSCWAFSLLALLNLPTQSAPIHLPSTSPSKKWFPALSSTLVATVGTNLSLSDILLSKA